MIKYMTELDKFWQIRKKSRDAVDKALASRSPEDKLKITEKMRANHDAMRRAK